MNRKIDPCEILLCKNRLQLCYELRIERALRSMGEDTNNSCILTTHSEIGYVIFERNIFVTNAERFWRQSSDEENVIRLGI